ncbi:MAG: DUF3363 domain-containing protein [Bryobacteraceae bacterium]
MTTKNDREPEFRLRPRRPPKSGKSEAIAWSVALKTVFRYASMSARNRGGNAAGSAKPRRQFNQRCAVRITYTKNKIAGQWRAHGRYISRESAVQDGAAGFSAESTSVQPAQILDRWQKEGDARLWKFIVSPEFGDRTDLQELTRELLKTMERDIGTRLEWIAVSHFNTEHAHTHVALRSVRDDGSVLDLPREYIKTGIRMIAEDLCTRQLGYRTELDAREAERREVDQCRVTSLDRIIERANPAHSNSEAKRNFRFEPGSSSPKRDQATLVAARLITLQKMGLASGATPGSWDVRSDFLTVLRAMQQVADRQKTISAHRPLASDERLPLVVTDTRSIKNLEGRVLGHGEDETGKNFGRHYMLLEGIDAKIHLIYYTPELEEARTRGQLGANAFVSLVRLRNDRSRVLVRHLGDAEQLLDNEAHFRSRNPTSRSLGGDTPDTPWTGWLGRYLERAASVPVEPQSRPNRIER